MGYADHTGIRHLGDVPAEPDGWRGVLVHTWDPDDPEDEEVKWIYKYGGTWNDWGELYGDIYQYEAEVYGTEIA